MPGTVCEHGFVGAPAVAGAGDGTDYAPGTGLGHGVTGIGAAAFGRIGSLGYAVGRHQEEVILHAFGEGDVVVGQLGAVVVIVEDEVFFQAEDIVAVLEVLVLLAVGGPGAGHLCAGPVAAVVVHGAPHVQGDGVPTGLVDDVDAYAAVLGQYNLALVGINRQEILFPLVGIDVGPFAGPHVEGVFHFLIAGGTLVALLHIVEREAVGQGFSILEPGGIQIDAPLGGNGLGMGHEVGGVADGGFTAVELTHDIDFVCGGTGLRHDDLQQNHVVPGLEGRLLVREFNRFLLDAGDSKGQDRENEVC